MLNAWGGEKHAGKIQWAESSHPSKMKKLSQAMLAEQGDTSERYIRDLERGQKRNPSASVVCSLSRALGLAAMDELMEITEEDRGE